MGPIQIPVCYAMCAEPLWSCLPRGQMNWQMITSPGVWLHSPCKLGTVACECQVNCTTPHIWPAKCRASIIECNQSKTKSSVEKGITSGVCVAAAPSSMVSVEITTDYNTPLRESNDVDKVTRVPSVTRPRSNICRHYCSSCCPEGDCDSRILSCVGRYVS